MANTCIRILADPVQIKECREIVGQMDDKIGEISRVLSLSGNSVRLKILFLLAREEEMCPCDLSDILDISVGGISQHLRKLKDAGLVVDKRVGQTIFYTLKNENILIIKPIIDMLLKSKTKKSVK